MGATLILARRIENLAKKNLAELKLTRISRELKHLSNFSSAIADGTIDPSELGGVGSENFASAMNFTIGSDEAAAAIADAKCGEYVNLYSGITQEEYFKNSTLMSRAELFFNPETGQLDEEAIRSELYEKALKEYAETYIVPQLHEYEEELTQEQTRLEAELKMIDNENQSLKDSQSKEIDAQTIHLS